MTLSPPKGYSSRTLPDQFDIGVWSDYLGVLTSPDNIW